MNFKIEITELAAKQYKKINNPYKDRIKVRIDQLSNLGLKISNLKSLSGEFKGLYRI